MNCLLNLSVHDQMRKCCVCFYMLLQFPGMRFVHLSQGFFGAPTPKPTTLLVLRLPALARHLHEGKPSSKLLYGTSVGKNDKGQFHKNILQAFVKQSLTVLSQTCVQKALVWHTAHCRNCRLRFWISATRCVITISVCSSQD